MDILNLFQGIATMFSQEPAIVIGRIVMMLIGILLVYLGANNKLEALIMIPMGFGMAAVNAGVLFISAVETGTLFIDPLVSETNQLMNILQIDFLQPVYNFTFSNGLIACLVFMGIGITTDIGFALAFPFTSMLIAMFAELGTIATFPLAVAMGFDFGEAAAIATIGTADGPMVLYASLMLAEELFVPITIVAYLYLSLTYGGYPYLVRLLVPEKYRGIKVESAAIHNIKPKEKIIFSIVACTILCLLFPVAAPLFMSFFLGVAIRESGLKHYVKLLQETFLYGATFFLGLMLGVLCEASTLLDPRVFKLLILGMLALLISGIGGIIGGYVVYFINKGNFNPAIGIAGVSCVPSTGKIAQQEISKVNPQAYVIQYVSGANICGVITSSILIGIYITIISPML